MNLKKIYFYTTIIIAFVSSNIYSQCHNETTTVCDITTIPGGVINLFDELETLTGIPDLTLDDYIWSDPNFNFALTETTGDLYLWDLDNSSENNTDYQFHLIDPTPSPISNCPNSSIIATLNVIIGPFEGVPTPVNSNGANIKVCQAGMLENFDIFQVFETGPSPHRNGEWTFIGNDGDPSNFVLLESTTGKFLANIPYVAGPPLVDSDIFEFEYTVPGITPCTASESVRVKVEVVRDVSAGTASEFDLCDTNIIAGAHNADIDLTDDAYLLDEDIEGTWSSLTDPTNQISSDNDNIINLKEVYDEVVATNPRFGFQEFTYTYSVEQRDVLFNCSDQVADIKFRIHENLRPFGQNTPLEFCTDATPGNTYNLYNLIGFTEENGVTYDYPNNDYTNWEFVSGPSDLGIQSKSSILDASSNPLYTSNGTINLNNLTNADAGVYQFRYTVSQAYNDGDESYLLTSGCTQIESTIIEIEILPYYYAGEDTAGLEFCESDFSGTIDLISLLNTNPIDGPIYTGPNGNWIDINTGNPISNPFTTPSISGNQSFDLRYETSTLNGCGDSAILSFTLYEEYTSGNGGIAELCESDGDVDLFSLLTGNPNANGTWTGPNGYTSSTSSAIFNTDTSTTGIYSYTVPSNALCISPSTTNLSISINKSPNSGNNVFESVCKSDTSIDLKNVLSATADDNGTFIDIDNTNGLNGSVLDLTNLPSGIYNFEYSVPAISVCAGNTSNIELTVIDVETPSTTKTLQSFCTSLAATVGDLDTGNSLDYNWYSSANAENSLSQNDLLKNNTDYYLANTNSAGCESERLKVTVTLIPLNSDACGKVIPDGITPNGDGENDELDLGNLVIAFPNFELKIFNRYGTTVYEANRYTESFKGESNAALTIGNELPDGVYFYIFDPKNDATEPFQGNFFLSR